MKSNSVTNQSNAMFSTRKMVIVGLLSAVAYVLMLVHLPFKYLGFLEIEFSDIPAVIAALQFGPLAGVFVELVKNLIKALTASDTGMIGELANFLISCAYIIPVGLLYKLRIKKKLQTKAFSDTTAGKKKQGHSIFMILTFAVGTIAMSIAGALLNYYIMLPLYAQFLGGMDNVVGFAAGNLSVIKDLSSLVIIGITPFNIFKGFYVSLIGYYTYRLLKGRILQ